MDNNEFLSVNENEIFLDYKIEKYIGKGAFSNVFKVKNLKTKHKYALKIGRISKRFQKSYENEIIYFKKLNKFDNKNLIKLIDFFKIKNRYFLVFVLENKNLYSYMRTYNDDGIPIKIVNNFTFQIINGLKCLKKINLIHADLKPENIIVSKDETTIKIIDLGSSLYESENKYHNYIQTRYYRSPEILIGLPISYKIDIWSLGCIIYEMIRGYPLFKAKNYKDLLLYQVNLLGIPEDNIIEKSQYGKEYFKKKDNNFMLKNYYDYRKMYFEPKKRYIEKYILPENQNVFNILLNCLKWKPEERFDLEALE